MVLICLALIVRVLIFLDEMSAAIYILWKMYSLKVNTEIAIIAAGVNRNLLLSKLSFPTYAKVHCRMW